MSVRVPRTNPQGATAEDSFRYSPLEHVRTLFVRFIQGLFWKQRPGDYHWEPHDDRTEIVISDENPIHTTLLGQRPAVSLTRGPVQFYSLGLDDMSEYDPRTGAKKKAVLVPGTMTINAVSRVALESERIAWWIAEALWVSRETLLAAGFFEVGRQPQILSPTPAGSLIAGDMADEYVVTAVTCPFQFQRAAKTTPLGRPIVQGVSAVLHGKLSSVGSKGPVDSFSAYGCRPPHDSSASDVYGATPSPGDPPPALPLIPHPLNPAMRVHIRPIRRHQHGLLSPAMNARAIPISEPCVPESGPLQTPEARIKV